MIILSVWSMPRARQFSFRSWGKKCASTVFPIVNSVDAADLSYCSLYFVWAFCIEIAATEASLLPNSPEVDIRDYRRELTLSMKHVQELVNYLQSNPNNGYNGFSWLSPIDWWGVLWQAHKIPGLFHCKPVSLEWLLMYGWISLPSCCIVGGMLLYWASVTNVAFNWLSALGI